MPIPSTKVIPFVLEQHAEDARVLYNSRSLLVAAPHVRLRHLLRFDTRLSAHLDGLSVGGEEGRTASETALASGSSGAMFTAAVGAIEGQHGDFLESLIALAESVLDMRRGLVAAFGWVHRDWLRGIVVDKLTASSPWRRVLGIAACALHRVDPSIVSSSHIQNGEPAVRGRAWRTVGELGKHELVSAATAVAVSDPDQDCAFWAAWSAVLLGDRQAALSLLTDSASKPGPRRMRAFQLVIQAMTVEAAHRLIQPLAQDPANIRWLIRGAGLTGDPRYIPTLIGFMANDSFARLAGEAFSLITGLDLAWLDLERKPPENFESGPNDDPNDPNVEMDEDDGLPWPDQTLIQTWWNANSHRFQTGVRYFMGEPLNRSNCVRVLKEGFQRQRIAAALYLPLLNPGTPLFEWRAPAWRQQRELALLT